MGYKKLLLVCASLGVLMILLGPPFYIGLPLSGRVVEAATGRLIEGAVVVQMSSAYRHFGIESDPPAGLTSVQEAVTDAQGRFTIGPWFSWGIWFGRIPSAQPQLIVLKAGYTPRRLTNESVDHPSFTGAVFFTFSKSVLRTSLWNGATIPLAPLPNDPGKQGWAINNATFDLEEAIDKGPTGRCEIIKAFEEYDRYMRELPPTPFGVPRSEGDNAKSCIGNRNRKAL